MNGNELTEYIKTAFEYKNSGNLKEAIDYFYKALAIDEESIEIMYELALLYEKLCRYDRSISLLEQILKRDKENNKVKFILSKLLKENNRNRAKEFLLELYNANYETEECAEELFDILTDLEDYNQIIALFNKNANKFHNSIVLYYTANAYYNLGNFPLAQEFYKKSYENNPQNILAGIKVAMNLYEKGQISEAYDIAQQLLKYGEDEEIYNLLAEISYLKSDTDSAIKYYSYAVKINPQNSDNYFKLGILFSIKGYYREAEECYCKAITIEPDNTDYNYALAYMYYMNNKYDLSEKLTDLILDINPNEMQTLALKALININKNDFAKVQSLITKLENNTTETDFPYYVKAVYYSKLNIWEKAINCINKAIQYNDNSLEYKYMLARLYYITGNTKDSKILCEKIIKKEPKYIQAYILLARLNQKERNYKEAIKNIDYVLSLDKNMPEVYYILAEINNENQNWEKAIENYKIALSMEPDKEKTYEDIAECYYKLGNYKEAYEYYKEASDFDVSDAKYRYYMAKCSIETDNKENAISNFNIMKRLEPNNIEYNTEYADYMYSIGKKKEARNIIKSLIKATDDIYKNDLNKHLKQYK